MQETSETQGGSLGCKIPPGGGNGNPLQDPCLENPVATGGWRATVRGVRVGYDRATNTHTSECLTDFTVSGPRHYRHLEWMFPVSWRGGRVTVVHCGVSTASLTFALCHPVTSPSPQSRQARKCPGVCQESAAGEGVGSEDPVENRLLLLYLCSLRSKGHSGIAALLRKSHTQLHVALLLDMKDGPSLPYGLGGGGWIIAHTVFPC